MYGAGEGVVISTSGVENNEKVISGDLDLWGREQIKSGVNSDGKQRNGKDDR